MALDKQTQRKIERHLQSESRWLQKVLFALDKAREARLKLAEIDDEDVRPLFVLDDGTEVAPDDLEKVIRARVEDLMERLGQGKHGVPW